MKIIDLLNKIANGEEVPKKIKYKGRIWHLEQYFSNRLPYYNNGYNNDNLLTGKENDYFSHSLNDEVEILEENKIPEKIKIEQDTPSSNYYIKNEYGTKCALTKHSKIIADKLNEIIDYLKNKGE